MYAYLKQKTHEKYNYTYRMISGKLNPGVLLPVLDVTQRRTTYEMIQRLANYFVYLKYLKLCNILRIWNPTGYCDSQKAKN